MFFTIFFHKPKHVRSPCQNQMCQISCCIWATFQRESEFVVCKVNTHAISAHLLRLVKKLTFKVSQRLLWKAPLLERPQVWEVNICTRWVLVTARRPCKAAAASGCVAVTKAPPQVLRIHHFKCSRKVLTTYFNITKRMAPKPYWVIWWWWWSGGAGEAGWWWWGWW